MPKTQEEILKKIRDRLLRVDFSSYQKFANNAKSIEISKSLDGKGLSTGADIDYYLVNDFLPDVLGDDFEKYQKEEADVKIMGEPASFKTLKVKGDTALSWSKNPIEKKDGRASIDRKFLEDPLPMIMYVRNSENWYKYGPKNPMHESIDWKKLIHSGFYLIDMLKASKYIILKENNKSNSIIDSQDMYRMLINASDEGNFISIPDANKIGKLRFSFIYE